MISHSTCAATAVTALALVYIQCSRKKREQQRDYQYKSKGVKRSRFREKQGDTKILCAPSNGEFNKCIDAFVTTNDNVLIIHCGSDGGEERAKRSSGRAPSVFQGSVWDVKSLLEAAKEDISVVCIDPSNIHGNDIFVDSIALVHLIRSLLDPLTIIVKSRLLAKHARSFHTVPQLQRTSGLLRAGEPVQVVCAVGVTDYRKTIPLVVEEGDSVLEIGCHFGKSTTLLSSASKTVAIGIDIGKLCIDRARTKYKNCRFEVVNAWDTSALLKLSNSFQAIYVDVGGISGADGELEGLALVRQLICAYGSNSKLRCIVVKSRCLRDHAKIWDHSDDVLRQEPTR